MRVAHTLVGAVAGVLWLLLPGATFEHGGPAAEDRTRAVAQEQDDSSAADLVLPLLAVATAGVVAGYAYLRRTRRARTRTTPGGTPLHPPLPPPLGELDEQARTRLIEADDCLRTSREELAFVTARFGETAVAPFARAVRDAETELAAAFRMRQQYDDGIPEETAARQHALAGIVGRCEEAGRRLDGEAAGIDRLRALEESIGDALEVAESRFRTLAGRTGTVETRLAELRHRYAPTATTAVTGYVEQAKDRLVFTTFRLNQAHQSTDRQDPDTAAAHLRAAEGAIAQATVFLDAVERLAADLTAADALVPAALTGAEAKIAGAREGNPAIPTGELRARLRHADAALAAVREERAAGPYDPLDALRRIVRATAPLGGDPATGVLGHAALLTARSGTAAAGDFIGTHRAAVGPAARTRLAEARRLLTADPVAADTCAREARGLAEQDVRVHGNPAEEHESGLAGAILGGVLRPDGTPASFGGPGTSKRRTPKSPFF